MKLRGLMFFILILPVLSIAQDSVDVVAQPPEINYNPDITGVLFKLFLSLIVVVGLIYVSIFILKKISNRNYTSSDQLIKVIGKSYLTPKQSLYIVKMGLSYAVLGVGEGSVNLLKELSPEEVESLQPPPKVKNGFQNILKSVLKR